MTFDDDMPLVLGLGIYNALHYELTPAERAALKEREKRTIGFVDHEAAKRRAPKAPRRRAPPLKRKRTCAKIKRP